MRCRFISPESIIIFCCLLAGATSGSCYREMASPQVETLPPTKASIIVAEQLLLKGQQELEKFTIPGYQEAIKYFEQALGQKPDFYQAYGRLAIAYGLWAKEKKELGLDNLEEWIKSSFYAWKAEEHGYHGDYLKASALVSNSRNFVTEYEYGEIFRSTQTPLRKERPDMAISYLRDLFSMGSFKRKTIDPALKSLDTVLKDNPGDAEALIFKAWVQMLTAEDDNLKKVLELKPDWSLPYFLLGLFQRTRGEISEAEKYFKLALEKNPEHPRALTELGELSFLAKKYEPAEGLLKQALALYNDIPRAHLISGFICREKGDYEEALLHFEAVTSLCPDHEEAIYYQALVLIEQAGWSQAVEVLNSLVKLSGSYEIYGYSLRALSYLMLNKLAEAEADCRQALTISPNYYLPYYILGLIDFQRENWKKASENFLKSLQVDKTFDDGHYYLGQTYLKLEMLKEGQEEIRRAAQLFELAVRQTEQLREQALARGWPKKAELLAGRKKELESKITHCQKLLAIR